MTTKDKKTSVIPVEKRPGTLIVFEWQDGSGKSTQISILHKLLEANGFFVVPSKWNSDLHIKPLTKKLKKKDSKIPATVFDMVHAADMLNRYQKSISGAIEAGMVVLCDRYFYTAMARGYGRMLDMKEVGSMYEQFLMQPDIVIHMRVPPELSLERTREPSDLSHYEAGMDMNYSPNILESFKQFQTKVDEWYLKLSKEYGFHTLDGSIPVYEMTATIRDIVNGYMEQKYKITLR